MQHTRVEPGAGELLALAERRLNQLEVVDVGQRIVDGRVRVDGGGLDSEQMQSAAVSWACRAGPKGSRSAAIGEEAQTVGLGWAAWPLAPFGMGILSVPHMVAVSERMRW